MWYIHNDTKKEYCVLNESVLNLDTLKVGIILSDHKTGQFFIERKLFLEKFTLKTKEEM